MRGFVLYVKMPDGNVGCREISAGNRVNSILFSVFMGEEKSEIICAVGEKCDIMNMCVLF